MDSKNTSHPTAEFTGDRLSEIAKFCMENILDHPAGYYIIATICDRLQLEYEDQAVPTGRFMEVNKLSDVIERALNSPDNMLFLNSLVTAAKNL